MNHALPDFKKAKSQKPHSKLQDDFKVTLKSLVPFESPRPRHPQRVFAQYQKANKTKAYQAV